MSKLATPEEMCNEALGHRGAIYYIGELGDADPKTLCWVDEPNFDLYRIPAFNSMSREDVEFFVEVVLERALENNSDEDAHAYVENMRQAILNGTIDPILVVQGHDGAFYVWDGWHRMGEAHDLNYTTMHAWVGYR